MAPVSLDRAAVGRARSHSSKEPPLQPPLAKLLFLHVGGLNQSHCFLQVSIYSQCLHLGVSCRQRPHSHWSLSHPIFAKLYCCPASQPHALAVRVSPATAWSPAPCKLHSRPQLLHSASWFQHRAFTREKGLGGLKITSAWRAAAEVRNAKDTR